jgi:hypothetical protein
MCVSAQTLVAMRRILPPWAQRSGGKRTGRRARQQPTKVHNMKNSKTQPGAMTPRAKAAAPKALPGNILHASFRYTSSVDTDLKKTFARVRREQRRELVYTPAPVCARVLPLRSRAPAVDVTCEDADTFSPTLRRA